MKSFMFNQRHSEFTMERDSFARIYFKHDCSKIDTFAAKNNSEKNNENH